MTVQKLKPEESCKRNKLKEEKPYVYEKVMKFDEKFKRGESIAIMHFQYNYICNFTCEHCSIKRFQGKKGERTFTMADVKELARQADELGLARFVITGGEPLIFKDLDALVDAIDPKKFYINCDTNGWLLDEKRAKHLKAIGVDRIQLSIDNLDANEHDNFRNAKGSHERAMRAVDVALAAGLDIFINTVVTKQRLRTNEFIQFIEYFNRKGVGVYVSYAKPVGAWEGNFDCLVDKADMDYMRELEKKHNVFTHLTPAYGLSMGCIAVKGMITITQYGDVLPCQYIQIAIGNVFKEPLKDIIQRGLEIKYFGEHIDTCLIAEDRAFIDKYIVGHVYGKPLPVPCSEVFTEEDKTQKPFNTASQKNSKLIYNMVKKFIRKCPICSNNHGEILYHQSFAILENDLLPKEYDVVCCQKCGFVYADTPANQQDYNKYYQQFSKYEWGGTTKWNLKGLKPISDYLCNKNASILDIGCANGELLVELKKLGYKNLTGLDPSVKCLQNVKNHGINAFEGELFSINLSIPNRKFDYIILSHVFEHICDLQMATDNIVSKLNENGVLYIEVPDASRYPEYYIVPFHYFDCEHINHFDENSLNNLFLQKNLNLLHYAKKESHVADKLYPAVYTLYQKRTQKKVTKSIIPNFEVRDSVISYVEKSHSKDKWPKIDKIAVSQEEIVVWGVGSYTLRLIDNSSLGKCNIVFFVDKDPKKQGLKVKDVPIYSPDRLKAHKGPIIISSALYSDEVLKEIKDMGINNDIVVMK
jgi:MoaA/NifB/PqqE/SkfB family radical SAM enzyme/SAM-dependent methyltransferase